MAEGWSHCRNDCKLNNINKDYFANDIVITADSKGVYFYTQKIVQKTHVAYINQPENSAQQALAQVQVRNDVTVPEQAYAEDMTAIASQSGSPPLAEATAIPSSPLSEVPVTHVKADIKVEI